MEKMLKPLLNLLSGREILDMMRLLKRILTVIVILILMILLFGLSLSVIVTTLVCLYVIGMICYIRGYTIDAEKSKEPKIVTSTFGRGSIINRP